ncbi:putative ribonuclease H-like domain-containing protein [Tanacetum coccineum]
MSDHRWNSTTTTTPPISSQTPTQQTPHTVTTIKLLFSKLVLPPRTAEEIVARERERKARTTLLMALPEDHLAKFHKMTDAKEMWDAIKSRFGGNDESKKMQKFQSLLSQLEIHGAGVSTEDANQKFLRSLPSAWSQALCSPLARKISAFVFENTSTVLNDVLVPLIVALNWIMRTWNKLDEYDLRRNGLELAGQFASECRNQGKSKILGEEMLGTVAIGWESICTETPELVSEPVVNESNVACQPKVWSNAPIIEEYESDSKDEYVEPVQVYVDDIIFGSTKKSWCDEFEALMKSRFQMSSMGELTFFLGLQVKQKADGIFISQDKYVAEILKKFDFVNVKTASTPIETQKPLVKDEEASDVDVHLYRSMIGSLMYLTASRPDIMFAVCACSRFQVTPKTSHLSAVKRIFRYLKGKPKLGLWYPRVSSFDLEAYSNSDYAGANLDGKSTTGEAKYVAAASCCGQVLWIQNQMLDYGFNFMNTKIYIDNESIIYIVKNPVYHSKTKHIAIRHHFIRDAYEKKLIQVLKIHTDDNVADLVTKAFDVSSSLGFRESLGRALHGTEALMLPKLFILWLATVSTDSAELVPMGKVSTAIKTLKKNIAKGIKCKLKWFP